MQKMLKSCNAKVVLDLGCGEGFITNFISQLPLYTVGADLDESIKIAKDKVDRADFVRASIINLPFRNSCFDAITLLEILEHLPDQALYMGIREIDRVLKPKGALIVSVPYRERIIYTRCIHCGRLTPLYGHLRSLDEQKITSLLPKNYKLLEKTHLPHLELISCYRIMSDLPFRLWFLINNILGAIRKGYWIILKYIKLSEH